MADDPFTAVKAILDSHARKTTANYERMHGHIERLREALAEIVRISSLDGVTGLALAKSIAERARMETASYYDGL